jgi:glutamate-5-semialdehyde dehydrogenase
MTVEEQIHEIGGKARRASRALALLSTEKKNAALLGMADALLAQAPALLAANARDIAGAEENALGNAAIDRLRLTDARIQAMADGIRQVVALGDPVGKTLAGWTRPNGIAISKISTPIGVIGIIYESRPNVTSDAAILCIKTGNAVILRGGSESLHSNMAIAAALQAGGGS